MDIGVILTVSMWDIFFIQCVWLPRTCRDAIQARCLRLALAPRDGEVVDIYK